MCVDFQRSFCIEQRGSVSKSITVCILHSNWKSGPFASVRRHISQRKWSRFTTNELVPFQHWCNGTATEIREAIQNLISSTVFIMFHDECSQQMQRELSGERKTARVLCLSCLEGGALKKKLGNIFTYRQLVLSGICLALDYQLLGLKKGRTKRTWKFCCSGFVVDLFSDSEEHLLCNDPSRCFLKELGRSQNISGTSNFRGKSVCQHVICKTLCVLSL